MLADPRRRFLAAAYAAAAAGVTFLFTLRAGWSGQLGDAAPAAFSRMVEGTAERPFVDRALLPAIVRGLHALLPGGLARRLDAIGGPGARIGWTTAHGSEVALCLALAFAGSLATAFVLRRLARVFAVGPGWACDLAPIGGLLLAPIFFLGSSVHVYDPAVLLGSALGLLFVAQRRRVAFYVVFVLACLNRETAILLAALFAWRERVYGRWIGHAAAQVGIWVGVQVLVRVAHAGNPGHDPQLLFPRNLALLIQPRAALPLWVLTAAFVALLARGWREQPIFLRRALAIVLGPLVLGTLLFGLPTETRDYLEALPILFLLAVPAVVALLRNETA
jgi:hypothetical protein